MGKLAAPKILFFDIETAGVNALKSDLGFTILFGYKWGHEKDAKIIKADAVSLRAFSDLKLLKKASAIFAEADLVAAHFGSVFDRRFLQGRLLINNLPPIPATKMRDTCMIVRSVANFSSNRLKYLAKILNFRHQKLENNWPTAWFKVMQGSMKTLDDLATYCMGDVLALEELYNRLRPFDNAHPRIFFGDGEREVCRACGGDVQYRGVAMVGEQRYRRFLCKLCARWDRERKAIKK